MYKIYCIKDINDLKYVGITKKKLNRRLNQHRVDKNRSHNVSSQKLDLDNCNIYLLEECDDKKREQYWIDKIDCVNDRNATYDRKERDRQYSNQYYIDHTEQKKQYMKQYNKQYCIDNKDKIKQYSKERREYQNSWGGRPDMPNNSLLKIDIDYFNS
jgi:hypothetical protein